MRELVLCGHDLNDYKDMFCLTDSELNSNILEYGCGPTAFNSQQQDIGHKTISFDKLFSLPVQDLKNQINSDFDVMVERINKNQDQFNLKDNNSLKVVIEKRRSGITRFIKDFKQGVKDKRYLPIDNNKLPFSDFSFDIAVCSHYLFSELTSLDIKSHLMIIKELARVAKEVRIFPLIKHDGEISTLLGPILLELQNENYGTEIKEVPYSLQKNGNAMLRVWAQQCNVG